MQQSTEEKALAVVSINHEIDSGDRIITLYIISDKNNYSVVSRVNEDCYSCGFVTKLLDISGFNSLDELADVPFPIRIRWDGKNVLYGNAYRHIWFSL